MASLLIVAPRLLATLFLCPLAVQGARVRRNVTPPVDMLSMQINGVAIYNWDFVPGNTRSSDGTAVEANVEWVVQLFDDVSTADAEKVCTAGVECIAAGHPTEGGLAIVQIQATKSQLRAFLGHENTSIESVEPSMSVRMGPPIRISSGSVASWGLGRVQARARAQAPRLDGHPLDGGKGVHVYVLDTGINTGHRDFGGRAVPTLDVTVRGQALKVCAATDSTCAMDRQGHGTHCAGSVGGNTFGIAKGSTLHAVKVLGDDGSGSSAGVLRAMDWVKANGIRPAVVSMSLGGAKSVQENNGVRALTQSGVTVVVAAGNENRDACNYSPGSAPEAINVGSTDKLDKRSSFSNWGRCVHIFAPGSDITSASHRNVVSSATMSGTSMACPHVAGASALVLGRSPKLTPLQVKSALVDAGTKGVLTDVGRGEPNVLLYTLAATMKAQIAAAPTAVSTLVCPEYAASSQPNEDGTCECPSSQSCYVRNRYTGLQKGCPLKAGTTSTSLFPVDCKLCYCYRPF